MAGLDAIFDQPRAIDWIRRALAAGRLPHAMIFAGPPGVGKGTTARAVAEAVLCDAGDPSGACGSCASCRAVAGGTHPDLHVVYRQLIRLHKEESKARDLSIDVIKDYLIEPAGRKSVMKRGKVFIIEEAQTMGRSAQNALLKTLEEPSGNTVIILIVSQAEALLPTIASRCQLIRFSPLSEARVVAELKARGIDAPTATSAARLTGGSLGASITWIADGVVASAEELFGRLKALRDGGDAGDFAHALKAAADAYAERALARDSLASKDQATREAISLLLLRAANELARELRLPAHDREAPALCSAIEACSRAIELLRANASVPLVLEHIAVNLAHELATR